MKKGFFDRRRTTCRAAREAAWLEQTMKDNRKTKAQLASELAELRQQVAAGEAAEAEHARGEKALQESESTLRTLINANPESVFLIDTQGIVLAANELTARRLNWSLDQLIGACLYDVIPPEAARTRRESIEQVIRTGLPMRFEDVQAGRYVDSYVHPILAQDGQVGRLAIVTADITERKWAQALERRVAQLTLLNDVGRQISGVRELESVVDTSAHLVQHTFGYHHVALFTLNREQGVLVMKARAGEFANLFPPEYRIKLGQGMVGRTGSYGQTLLANDVRTEPYFTNFFPDKIPTRAELTVPIRVGAELVGVLDVQSRQINAFDENDVMVIETLADQIAVALKNAALYQAVQEELAERKQAEAALRQSQAQLLQSAKMASLGVMAGGIAHELRNPLGIISANTGLLMEHPDELELRGQCVEKILAATQRASLIIENLLKFARPQSERVHLVDLHAVMDGALALLRHQLALQQVIWNKDYQPDLPRVQGTPELLQQVFINLILNACHAMPKGGTLSVGTRTATGNQVEIWFTDTGCGIPADLSQTIFEPFFTTRPPGDGIGLGLSVSYSLIQQHQGTIEVKSQVDQGATFIIRLPCAEQNDA